MFLTPWNCAIVKPLHKGGDCASPMNYCPISFFQSLAKYSRGTFISSFHNIFTPTTCSILFSLDFVLPTQAKLFFSTALTNGIRPLTLRSIYAQCSRHFLQCCQPRATSIQTHQPWAVLHCHFLVPILPLQSLPNYL